MFKKIIKRYLSLFIVFFAGYTFLNWFLTTKTGLIRRVDNDYSNFWIPFFIIYILTFFVLRPIMKKTGFSPKIKEGLVWVIFPFSIAIPTAFSQQYFKDISYKIINVKSPEDVLLYPKERFFNISKFRVNHAFFTLYKERHVSGGRSKTLKVNNYFIAPMSAGTVSPLGKVAYGIKFSKSLNHGYLFRKNQPEKIEEFNKYSENEFLKYDLYNVTFFEKQMDSDDAENFAKAWRKNNLLNQTVEPVVLINKQETLQQLFTKGRNMTIYSIIISLTVTISLLLIFDYYSK